MRNIKQSLLFLALITLVSLSSVVGAAALKRCPDCGNTQVPFPLSTAPNCGDPSYKIRCTGNTLFLDSISGSAYAITAINPSFQRLIVQPPGLAAGDANNTSSSLCLSTDFKNEGMWIDSNSPFNITSSNTEIRMNCSQAVFTDTTWNCSSSSICHKYLKENAAAAEACGGLVCCDLKTGGSSTAYRLRVRKERCAAYASFPYLDPSLPVSMWRPGVEIEWQLPEEPRCTVSADCLDLANSDCSPNPAAGGGKGGRKCLCKFGFKWDPVNGICQSSKKDMNTCQHGRGCKHRRKKTPLIGGLALAGAIMLTGALIMVLVFYLRRQRIERETQQRRNKARNILNPDNSGKSAKNFSMKEITKATNNFSNDNLLGSGGFGEVFKATLDDGTITAIKRPKLGNTRGNDQILNEVRILCQVNHRSLVRLLGCCVELPVPLLIYEYVPNGTLFEHLHCTTSEKWIPLGWHTRLRIAHQTAEGLAYLHNAAIPKIYHRDIKSSNILLDENLDAKVADFGLSRLAVSEATHITTCAQGTLGYLDPEYYVNFQLTDKSDVYSFGVVLFEMLTSKKAIDFNREQEDVNLVVLMKRALKEERLMDAVDPMLKTGASRLELESMKAFGFLAAACLDERRQNRPSMKDVADEIEYIISLVAGLKAAV